MEKITRRRALKTHDPLIEAITKFWTARHAYQLAQAQLVRKRRLGKTQADDGGIVREEYQRRAYGQRSAACSLTADATPARWQHRAGRQLGMTMTHDLRQRIRDSLKKHWPQIKSDPEAMLRAAATDVPQASDGLLREVYRELAEDIIRDYDIADRLKKIEERWAVSPLETASEFLARAVEAGDQDAIDLVKSMELDSRAR